MVPERRSPCKPARAPLVALTDWERRATPASLSREFVGAGLAQYRRDLPDGGPAAYVQAASAYTNNRRVPEKYLFAQVRRRRRRGRERGDKAAEAGGLRETRARES